MEFETLPLFSKPLFSWNLHTEYVGRRFIYRPSTESTMDDARSMLQRWRFQDGAVMLAETQTAGRGRAGRSWVSPPDVNLYFTLILRLTDRDPRSLSYVTPLAIAEAIEATAATHGGSLHVDLKWPNDAQIDGRKVAGVLIETATSPEDEPVGLIGVGINVNVDPAAYPEIADIATSVKAALGFEVPRETLLAAFCDHFERLFEEAASGSRRPFEAWKQRLVTLGREVTATGGGQALRGVAADVNPDGSLVIETPDGVRHTVEAGDVTLSAG
ncbi:MAG TPA: biotin--[acetyl-CoA-carboxylase] ligase [Dehalococcoidia bacterium]|nr:biotin--[acetyl-CoA-carboxylase] ligase [Dehalococcoidia bacterium]